MRIGLDLDNTLVDYDDVFVRLALPYLTDPALASKEEVRAALRLLPDGERQWQRLQGQAYGPRMSEARPFLGVDDFLRRANDRRAEVWIVSHKTLYGHDDPSRTNLRDTALAWLEERRFLSGSATVGLTRDRVLFADSRDAKIELICERSFDWFIDDLPEIFTHPRFPAYVGAILFSSRPPPQLAGISVLGDWPLISQKVFP